MDDNKVRVTVYRGAEEIGGCCTEISYKGTRIAIDFGSPLPEEKAKELNIEGLTYGSSTFDAVLLTHYHGDHIGEIGRINADIPVYMGRFTKDIIAAYKGHNPRLYTNIDVDRFDDLTAGKEISIGSLKITPLLSDHSASESFMFFIKAGNFHILHTGDFRLHGRFKKELLASIKEMGQIDLLITEGTTLSRKENEKENYTEEFVENKIQEYIYENKYCFVILSSTNFERFQGISDSVDRYRIDNKPKGKYFVVDGFQKKLFEIAEKRLPDRYIFKTKTTYGKNLDEGMENRGFVMMIRAGSAIHKALLSKYLKKYQEETILIYSMYTGYKEKGKLKALTDLAHDKNRLRVVHSSGHVTKQDLISFVDTVAAKNVIVIHTKKESEMEQLKNQIPIENGNTIEFETHKSSISRNNEYKIGHSTEEILATCKKALVTNPEGFYKIDATNYRGKTTDENNHRYYTEVIAEFLSKDNNLTILKGIQEHDRKDKQDSYNMHHTGAYPKMIDETDEKFHSQEKIIAIDLFRQSEKYGSLEYIGKIKDYQTPLKAVQKDPYGEIDLLAVNEDEQKIYILELKKNKRGTNESPETMLHCILEAYTYYKLVKKNSLLNDFDLSAYDVSNIVISPLVFKEDKQYKEWQEIQNGKRPHLRDFIDKLDVEVIPFFLEARGNNEYNIFKE